VEEKNYYMKFISKQNKNKLPGQCDHSSRVGINGYATINRKMKQFEE